LRAQSTSIWKWLALSSQFTAARPGWPFESCSEARLCALIREMHVVESDARLVARCRAGDDDAWRELVERFSRYVYAIAVQAYLPRQRRGCLPVSRAYENCRLRDDSAIRPLAVS
jgi:hypothetical protein